MTREHPSATRKRFTSTTSSWDMRASRDGHVEDSEFHDDHKVDEYRDHADKRACEEEVVGGVAIFFEELAAPSAPKDRLEQKHQHETTSAKSTNAMRMNIFRNDRVPA